MKKTYAGFWKRAVAHIIDSCLLDGTTILIILFLLILTSFIFKMLGLETSSQSIFDLVNPFLLQIVFFFVRGVLSLLYYGLGIYYYQTTFGKRLFHLIVVSEDRRAPVSMKQSFIRSFGYFLSYLPMGAGFLMAGFHPKKQALHDWLAGTVCLSKN